jgi:hypothetical protein
MYADAKIRQLSLQAKIASFPSLRLVVTRSGEPISLYVAKPQTLYKGGQGSLLRGRTLETSFGQSLSTLLPLSPFLHTPL